jgi:hypothetical protein
MADDEVTLLAALVAVSDNTHSEIIDLFHNCARVCGEDATLSARTLRRWLKGDVQTEPRPAQRRVARRLWGYPMEQLLGPASGLVGVATEPSDRRPPNLADQPTPHAEAQRPADTLERQVAMATRRAADFTSFAEADNIGPEAIAQLRDDITSLANAYIHEPLPSLMADLLVEQEIAFRLLEGKQKPALSRELYVLAALISGMIAKASQDVGRLREAMTHSRTMYVCADNADHAGLRAWGRGLQSLIAFWAGRPQEAVRYALAGGEIAADLHGSVAMWLPALEARAYAMMSATTDATRALHIAGERRGGHTADDLDELGGLFTFPLAKQSYYAAGTYVSLAGGAARAESAALTSLDQFDHGVPEYHSYSDEAGARTELALSRVHTGQLDGIREAIAPVLTLAPDRRIGGILTSANRVHQALSKAEYASTTVAREIRDEIESFCRLPAAALSV